MPRATSQPSIACGPCMAAISAGMVMNGPTPIMFDMFSAVASSSPKRRSRWGWPEPAAAGSAFMTVTFSPVAGASEVLLCLDQFENLARLAHERAPAVGQDVEFAICILAERRDVGAQFAAGQFERLQRPLLGVPGRRWTRGKQHAVGQRKVTRPVAEDIFAREVRQGLATIHIAPGHADAFGLGILLEAVDVLVFEDWIDERLAFGVRFRAVRRRLGRILRIETMVSLAHVPSVVAAFDDDVDLLEHRLPDFRREQFVIAAAIERHPPRVAQAVGIDFRTALLGVRKWIVRRDRVRIAMVDVDAQDLAEQRRGVLAARKSVV